MASLVCMLETEYPESDAIQIIPAYSGVRDEKQAITLNSKKPTNVSATKFHNQNIRCRLGISLLIFKNSHFTGEALTPDDFIDYVVIVVKPENGKVATFGKLPKHSDFFWSIWKYSSRPLVRITQYYQRVCEENPDVFVPARLDAEGRNDMRPREKQDAAYRAALEADLANLTDHNRVQPLDILLKKPLFLLYKDHIDLYKLMSSLEQTHPFHGHCMSLSPTPIVCINNIRLQEPYLKYMYIHIHIHAHTRERIKR
ncbi:uncharacterized protein LOC132286260 isoform X2 [Cornus florida]|uniref:uncharacterized protein LOC132286260 isoform X2 n=1 Tax=Cornus florida TaxID=4283 RepID=UPI0028A20942|nr:uncharacterized protein LOC132286260 isoform X2 [Cornus florida]